MSMTQRTWRIGLTGGIGSGKSTVAGFLARRGAAIIDADAISRSLTAPGGRAMADIAHTFGAAMLSPDGAMDRQAMRERISVIHKPNASSNASSTLWSARSRPSKRKRLCKVVTVSWCLMCPCWWNRVSVGANRWTG
jgi:cytidylate kinase